MKEIRDLEGLTIHDVQPVSDEYTTGRWHSLCESRCGWARSLVPITLVQPERIRALSEKY
jgi:hypothetical protein